MTIQSRTATTPAQVAQELEDHGIPLAGKAPTNGNGQGESAPSTEAISSNFYYTLGKEQVFHIQTTVRGVVTPGQAKQHLAALTEALKQVVALGGRAKAVGKPDLTPNAAAPAMPSPQAGGPSAPPPPPAGGAPAASSAPSESACAMIEVATSYTGNKPQLKFHVNGLEHPITFTKSVEAMAKLLAPLGFTAAHMAVGQKYSVNCLVTWVQNGQYKNVVSVRAG